MLGHGARSLRRGRLPRDWPMHSAIFRRFQGVASKSIVRGFAAGLPEGSEDSLRQQTQGRELNRHDRRLAHNINLLLLALCDKGKYAKLCDGLSAIDSGIQKVPDLKQLKKGNMISATEKSVMFHINPLLVQLGIGAAPLAKRLGAFFGYPTHRTSKVWRLRWQPLPDQSILEDVQEFRVAEFANFSAAENWGSLYSTRVRRYAAFAIFIRDLSIVFPWLEENKDLPSVSKFYNEVATLLEACGFGFQSLSSVRKPRSKVSRKGEMPSEIISGDMSTKDYENLEQLATMMFACGSSVSEGAMTAFCDSLSRIGWGQEKDSESLNLCNPKKIMSPRFQRMMLEGLRGMEIWHSMMDRRLTDANPEHVDVWNAWTVNRALSGFIAEKSVRAKFDATVSALGESDEQAKSSLATFDDEEGRMYWNDPLDGFPSMRMRDALLFAREKNKVSSENSLYEAFGMDATLSDNDAHKEFRKRQRGILERVTENWERRPLPYRLSRHAVTSNAGMEDFTPEEKKVMKNFALQSAMLLDLSSHRLITGAFAKFLSISPISNEEVLLKATEELLVTCRGTFGGRIWDHLYPKVETLLPMINLGVMNEEFLRLSTLVEGGFHEKRERETKALKENPERLKERTRELIDYIGQKLRVRRQMPFKIEELHIPADMTIGMPNYLLQNIFNMAVRSEFALRPEMLDRGLRRDVKHYLDHQKRQDPSNGVILYNLPIGISEEELRGQLEPEFGEIEKIVIVGQENGAKARHKLLERIGKVCRKKKRAAAFKNNKLRLAARTDSIAYLQFKNPESKKKLCHGAQKAFGIYLSSSTLVRQVRDTFNAAKYNQHVVVETTVNGETKRQRGVSLNSITNAKFLKILVVDEATDTAEVKTVTLGEDNIAITKALKTPKRVGTIAKALNKWKSEDWATSDGKLVANWHKKVTSPTRLPSQNSEEFMGKFLKKVYGPKIFNSIFAHGKSVEKPSSKPKVLKMPEFISMNALIAEADDPVWMVVENVPNGLLVKDVIQALEDLTEAEIPDHLFGETERTQRGRVTFPLNSFHEGLKVYRALLEDQCWIGNRIVNARFDFKDAVGGHERMKNQMVYTSPSEALIRDIQDVKMWHNFVLSKAD
eukprot:g4045.t1